jgi:selenium metabolism protein YedF
VNTTVVVNRDTLGHGSDELGQALVGNFLRKLWASEQHPAAIVFYNSGVRLLSAGSAVLDALDGLARGGVDLIACGTCVRFYGLEERMAAGRVSDMQEIVSRLMESDRVITI